MEETVNNTAGFVQTKYDEWMRFWNWALSVSDPRVKDWLFMGTPWPTFYLTLAYIVIICGVGPKMMEKRKAFDLKAFMVKTPLPDGSEQSIM